MTNDLLSTGIFLSGLTYAGYMLRSVPQTIGTFIKRRAIFKVTVYQHEEFYQVLESYLAAHNEKGFSNVSVKIQENHLGKRAAELVHHSDSFILRRAGKRILIKKEMREPSKGNDSLLLLQIGVYEITGIFAKEVIEEMIQEIIHWDQNKNPDGVVKIYSAGYSSWELINQISPKALDKIYMNEIA